MDKALGVTLGVFAIFIGAVGLVCFFSMFATFLWYCTDETTAQLTGIPALGDLLFFYVWPTTLLIGALFRGSSSSSSSK